MILAQLKHTVRFLLVGSAALGGLTFVLLGPRATQGQATAPQITFINVRSVGGDTATIDFSTNVPTEARIHYGLTSSYTTYEPASTWDGEKITHEIILSSLTQNTTYHFQIEVRLKGTTVCNFGTDCAKSADRTLRTSSGTGAGSLAITGITADCIDTSCYLIYSTSGDSATVASRWGISTASNFSGNPPDPAGYPAGNFVSEASPQSGKRSIQIGPLVANTTYYYRLQATGGAGQFTTDELTLKTSTNAVDHVFSTGACRDGTAIGACNNNHEYCSTSGSLIQDCSRCGFLCPVGQTCTGSVGSGACIVDPALNGAPSQCNQPDCYTPSGQFINPAPAGCYASWSACSANTILKVRKDRGCNLWLSCDSTFQSSPNPASGTVAENQCLSLVGCNQINDKGQCVNPLPTGQCSNDPIRFCNVDSDCTAGGTCNLSSAQDPAAGLLDLTYNHPSSVGSIADLSGNVLAGLDWTQNGANIIPGKLPWQLMRQLGGDALITNGDFEATQPPSVAPWQPAPTRGLPFGQPPATLHAEFEDQNNSTNHVLRVSPGLQTNWGCIVNNICPSGSAKSGAACTSAADCPPGGTYEQFSGVASPPFSATRGTLYYGEVRIKAVTGNPKLRIQFGYDDYTSFNVTVNNKNFHTYVDVTATTAWQRVAVGPIQGMTGLTKFAVVCADANNCGPFFVDDIQVRPFLQVDTAPHFVTPSCRLFPKTDARSCDYTDQTGVTFKGWKGYCLDHDSATGICLSWWPVDIIKGEGNIFGSEPVAGYQDRAPLYFCSQAQGGPLYADLKMTNTELGDVKNEMRFDWFNIGGSGATYCVDDDGSCPVSVSGAPALPKIRYEDIDQYQVLVDVNDNESRWGTTSPNYEFQSTVSKAGGTSQYLINVLQNIHHETVKIPDSGGTFNFADSGTTYDDQYWGWGGFCLPGAFDCKTYLQKHTFMELFKNLCDTSPDLNYLVVALKFDPNTHFIKDTMVKLCDSGSGDIGNNGLVSFRPIVKAHQSCDQIIQTVQSPAQGALNKAWAQRTQQNSGYTIPDLGIGYGNDKAPFGALLAPNPADNPSAWTVLTAAEPSADPQTPARAGTPYSCVLSCGTGPLDTKYCLSSELPQDLSTASCEGASCKTGTENRCQTVADIQSCNTRVQSSLNGNAFCVGNPLGRCSNNRTKACATDNDCGKGNSCSNPAGGSAKGVNSSFGIDRIKRLFAQSYGCWGLQFGTTLVPDPTVPSGTLTQVTSSYSSGFGCIAASSWDIYTDGPNNFPKLCLSNTRPAFDPVNGTDYCAIQPTVTNASLVNITNGTCSNNAAVTCSSDAACGPSNHCVTNITGGSTTAAIKFNTAVDAEQVPLDTISIDWGDSGANSQDTISFKAAPRTDKNNPLIFSHVYTVNAGDPACSKNSVGLLSCVYHPKVQLKDGWGICNANDGTCDDGSSANWEDTKIVIHLTQ